MPWSSMVAEDDDRPTVDPALFRGADDEYPGGWVSFPPPWTTTEDEVLAGEVRARLRDAIDTLPERQRTVVTLRDVLGHTATEVCEMLAISEGNQRVLLHRGRAAARARLAPYLEVTGHG